MHPCLVIRHGAAENRAASGEDRDRALTGAGMAAIERCAAGLVLAAPGSRLAVHQQPRFE